MSHKQIQHRVEEGGDRLDHHLAACGVCTSRSEALQLIKDSRVLVNGRKTKPSYKVQEGDVVQVEFPPTKPSDLTPLQIDFEVFYEDADLLVLNKPAGLVVHPGAGNYERSLVHGLLYHCKDLSGIGGVERPGIVHRLDKGTSGLMVVAKNDASHQHLADQFKNHQVYKIYEALCLGAIEKQEQTLRHLMKRAEINRKKFVVNQKKGKEAITHVTVLKKNARASHVSVKIDTGRTHQIRVHLHHIGHPILGDELYGGTKKLKGYDEGECERIRNYQRPLLHAKELRFEHPKTHKVMGFDCPLPPDFCEALRCFLT